MARKGDPRTSCVTDELERPDNESVLNIYVDSICDRKFTIGILE